VVAAGARGGRAEVRAGLAVAALLLPAVAAAQDVRGLEVCTAEKDMARRTGCLQANVEYLQQELTKLTRRAAEERAATARENTALKADVATLKTDLAAVKDALSKAQGEIAELKKNNKK
jgi:septal ring factor EnvC (AmiA/AmiB activator)